MAFKFRFETVLQYREKMEQQKIKELFDIRRTLLKEEEKFTSILDKRMEMIEFLRNIQNSSDFDLIFMNITQGFLMKLDEDLEFQKKVIENIKQLLSAKRKELVKISQDKKIIEKLKENEYEAYVKMMDKKENLFLDDMSSKLYNKKINSNKAYGK